MKKGEIKISKAPEEHHKNLSPSSFPMRSRCGRFEADGGNRYSTSGTKQHIVFASLFETTRLNLFHDDITEHEMEGLEWARDQVLLECTSEHPLELEKRLTYSDAHFDDVYFGTVDVVNGPHRIFDLKAGEEHAYWAQMAGYALANMIEHGSEYVNVTLLYSRYKRKKNYTITYKDAMMAINDIIVKSEDPQAKETPNEFCHWCARIVECEAIKERLNIIAAFQDWELEDFSPEEIAKAEDPNELSKAITLARLMKKWVGKIEALGKELPEDADPPPGFHWKNVSGRINIKDALACFKRSGLSEEAILRASTISVTRLQDEYVAGMGITKKEAKAEVEERMADIITTTKPYRTLEEVKNTK